MQIAYRALANYLTADPERVEHLFQYAKKHPYSHLGDYMGRYWVFNPYQDKDGLIVDRNLVMRLLPSARIHIIMRPDADRHLHNHPWNAQRIVLRGWYKEEIEEDSVTWRELHTDSDLRVYNYDHITGEPTFERTLRVGDTRPIRHGEFHRITEVSEGGAMTLFITGRYQSSWGFKVGGEVINYKEYLANKVQ